MARTHNEIRVYEDGSLWAADGKPRIIAKCECGWMNFCDGDGEAFGSAMQHREDERYEAEHAIAGECNVNNASMEGWQYQVKCVCGREFRHDSPGTALRAHSKHAEYQRQLRAAKRDGSLQVFAQSS